MNVLLLQGPVGPFFLDLQKAFETRGCAVTRVVLNHADKLFACKKSSVQFQGTLEEWETWLDDSLSKHRFDLVVYFGNMRPAHVIAEMSARKHGVETLSLEEGYLRSGYVSCESGGNNLRSPIFGKLPETEQIDGVQQASKPFRGAFWSMSAWGALYYFTRSQFSQEKEVEFYHRITCSPQKEAILWIKNSTKLLWSKISERAKRQRLTRKLEKNYIIVPLQLPSDSQLQFASNGWTLNSLASSILAILSELDSDLHVVFKMHPLDTDRKARREFINEQAIALGVKSKTHILDSGSIGDLCKHSAGMVLINSTSGFSAIHHGIPLLVMGKAIYRNPDLVTCGETAKDISKFLSSRSCASASLRKSYLQFVIDQSLVPGDFYAKRGRELAASQIVHKFFASQTDQRPIAYEGTDTTPAYSIKTAAA